MNRAQRRTQARRLILEAGALAAGLALIASGIVSCQRPNTPAATATPTSTSVTLDQQHVVDTSNPYQAHGMWCVMQWLDAGQQSGNADSSEREVCAPTEAQLSSPFGLLVRDCAAVTDVVMVGANAAGTPSIGMYDTYYRCK